MATRQVAKNIPAWRLSLARWAYYRSYFPQLGLQRDDTLRETPEVKEALRRLPKKLYDERMFRIIRALDLSNKKTILPKEEWTKFEEDEHYLLPYLDQVQKEAAEKQEWWRK